MLEVPNKSPAFHSTTSHKGMATTASDYWTTQISYLRDLEVAAVLEDPLNAVSCHILLFGGLKENPKSEIK